MKALLILMAWGFLCTPVFSQQYVTALGIKADYTTADVPSAELSLKHFFAGPSAFEVNLGGSRRYIWMQAMYLRNQFMRRDLEWYWGAGLDGGYWTEGNGGRTDLPQKTGFWSGLNGTVGLEYTFHVVPINLALDTGPTLRVVPEVKFGWMAGFSLRYAFR